MFRLFGLFCLVAGIACGSDSTAPSGPPDISGQWTVTLNISNSQLSASCSAQGVVINFTQTGSSFSGVAASGSQTCSVLGTANTSSLAGTSWTGGQINGTSVSFNSAGGCTIIGTVSGSPPNRMSGTLNCPVALSGASYVFTGTWSAGR
jgi:hypothetical protein